MKIVLRVEEDEVGDRSVTRPAVWSDFGCGQRARGRVGRGGNIMINRAEKKKQTRR